MRWAVPEAWRLVRARRGRALLAGGGVLAAALVLGVALTVVQGLASGFDRAASRAELPSVIARFDEQDRERVREQLRTLPNLETAALRYEETDVPLRAGGRRMRRGVVQAVSRGERRGYAVVDGRDLRAGADEVVVERGLVEAWDLAVGDELRIGRRFTLRIAGVAVAPDNVAYPLAPTARVYVSREALEARFGPGAEFPVNTALLWAVDESRTDVLLSAARQTAAASVQGLRFVTREGVQALVSQTAGIVIALLVAFGAVAAGLAAVLLGAGAQAEVQRRLASIGVRRAVGLRGRDVVALHAAEGALVAAPAAALGLAIGAVAAGGPTASVLRSLNQLPADGGERVALLAVAWLAVVAGVALFSALPARSAARRPVAALLRGGDVAEPRGRRWRAGRAASAAGTTGAHGPAAASSARPPGGAARGGLTALGVRLAAARRVRFGVVVGVVGAAASVALLLLALASLLIALRDDPATLGKRYQLTARLPAEAAADVARIRGVEAVAPRYSVDAVSATSLGSPLRVVAYPGDHTRFEAPALADGRRVRADGEAEVGAGLADAVGLRVGSTLAVQPEGAEEVRFRVVGVVRALQDEGRVAFVRPGRLQAALGDLPGPLAIRLRPGADRAAVTRELDALGAEPLPVGGATGDNREFLAVLAALLRLVAGAVALVVLYALAQSLALTARERRGAVATLRAAGADGRALRRLLAGSALAVAVPAALLAVALEDLVLAPLVERLAAGYADLPLAASAGQMAAVAGGLAGLALAAAAVTARRLGREPVVAGLREAER